MIYKKYHIVILHILFWFMIYAHDIYYCLTNSDKNYLFYTILNLVFVTIIFYTNYFILIDKYIKKRKYLLYIILNLTISLILFFGYRYLYISVIKSQENFDLYETFHKYLINIPSISLYLIIPIFAKFYFEWKNSMKREYELKLKKNELEIRYLKNQLNPHFFFNNLNNLYSLSIKNANETSEMILELSDTMRRYMNSSKSDSIPITQEIMNIKQYIKFQLLKKPKSDYVDFYTEGDFEGHYIVPLILINFVENAFKHSNISHDENGYINIECYLDRNKSEEHLSTLRFYVTNSIGSNTDISINHLGNQNIRRLLELSYPDRYKLETLKSDNEYLISLTIRNI